jgi:outer membrane lipoprotein-sorting protein
LRDWNRLLHVHCHVPAASVVDEEEMKNPKSKVHVPNKFQFTNSIGRSYRARRMRSNRPLFSSPLATLGFWILFGIWILDFGFSSRALAAEDTSSLLRFLSSQTNLVTWSADLRQVRYLKTLTQPLSSTGRLWFAAPSRFRWEIGEPAQTIAVRGKNELVVIYPRLKRVEKYPLNSASMERWRDMLALLDAGFPRSQADLEERFKIISITRSNDMHVLAMQPKSSAARKMIPQLTLSFATNDFQLRATELQMGDGSVMRNEFSHVQLNPKLDESLFTPKIDPDFKVVEPLKR